MLRRVVRDCQTGCRDIDAGNEGLAYLLERVFDPLVECRRRTGPCDHSACTKIGAIVKFLGRNFARQEEMMAGCDYPRRDEHIRDHRRLVEDLVAMQAARICGDRDRSLVRDYMMRWSSHHVVGSDRHLGEWSAARQPEESGS